MKEISKELQTKMQDQREKKLGIMRATVPWDQMVLGSDTSLLEESFFPYRAFKDIVNYMYELFPFIIIKILYRSLNQ